MKRLIKRLFLQLICLGAALAFLSGQFFSPTFSSAGFSSALFSSALFSSSPAIAQTNASEASNPFAVGTYDSIIIDFSEEPEAISMLTDSLAELDQLGITARLNSKFSESDHIYVMEGDSFVLEAFLDAADIAAQTEFIEPNYIYATSGFSVNDPDYAKQWNFKQINAEGAWEKGVNGRGVTVAVIDTGVSKGPDLNKTDFVPGYDFVNDRENANDDNGHGTHVAGTIAQSTNNNYGVTGIAYGAKIMPLKVLSRGGSGTVADIAEAIRFAADHGADVINMSLGGGGRSKLMSDAIDYAYSKGVVVVAAAGNSGLSSASYPALYEKVIGVSAIGPDEQKTTYSNYGTGVDIAAPGGATRRGEENGILQETINPRVAGEFQFKYFQGTSMAAPHVAGVAALIKSQGRRRSPAQVWEILKTAARPVKDDPRNYYGAGYLNAEKAVSNSGFIRWDWSQFDWRDMATKLVTAAFFTWVIAPKGKGFKPGRISYLLGLLTGSIGVFLFRAVEISILPAWPLKVLGTALPELGQGWFGTSGLNPLFASLVVPFVLMMFLISMKGIKWWSLGISVGAMAFMMVSAFGAPEIAIIGSGQPAVIFLLVNVVVGALLTRLFFQVALNDS
ncbi:MAG: S8 family serine peptidase [Cyanobacteria bacterium J06631_9]